MIRLQVDIRNRLNHMFGHLYYVQFLCSKSASCVAGCVIGKRDEHRGNDVSMLREASGIRTLVSSSKQIIRHEPSLQ